MWKLSPFELSYSLDSFENTVMTNLFIVLGYLTIILVFFNIIFFEKSRQETIYSKLFIFIGINTILVLASGVLLFITFAGSMCARIENDIYISNSFFPTKIIRTNTDCGASDSDFPKYSFRKVVEFTPFVRYICDIDTSNIDKSEWMFVGKSEK